MNLISRARLVALAMLFVSLPVHAAPTSPDAARPFVLCDAYCAIVNAQGKLVSDRVFERVNDATAGAIVYEHNGKRGALDVRGKRIVKPIYDGLIVPEGEPFLEGYINGKRESSPSTNVLIDQNGHVVLRRVGERVGAWKGHPYYLIQCTPTTIGSRQCGTFFTDDQGRVIAWFAYFYQNGDDPLAQASPDGRLFGFVGPDLKYRVPPRYTHVEFFEDGYALVANEKGMGLIDEQGHVRVAPGTFKELFGDRYSLFYVGFTANNQKCGQFVRRDGTPVTLPAGVCPYSSDASRKHGYALVGGAGGMGAINADGVIFIKPRYAQLSPLTSKYLVFAPKRGGPYGMIDLDGHVLIQPEYLFLKPGPEGTVVAQQADRSMVLLDDHGKRLGKLDFYDLEPLSEALLSYKLKQPNGQMESGFLKADGTVLPQHGSASRIQEPAGQPPRFLVSEYVGPGVFEKGLMDDQGRIIVPLAKNVQEIKYLGDDLWRVRRYRRDSAPEDDVYNAAGQLMQAFSPYREIKPFRDGVTTARQTKAQDNPVLINTQGKVLASYAALFPLFTEQARGGDGIVMQTLDRCYIKDPAAEPEDQSVEIGVDKRICADPALRALSRQTEKAYYSVQTGPCLPEVFMSLRPSYDKALAACADGACLRQAMLDFQKRLDAVAKVCVKAPSIVSWSDKPMSERELRLLTRLIAKHGENYYPPDADSDSSDGQGSLSFQRLKLGKLPAALVMQNTTAHNQPFWLLAKNSHGGWRIILQDYAGYLRGFDVAGATHNGLPVLRVQQHASCCEHDVQYFQYDGHRYRSRRQCTQLYDGDDGAVLFCGALDDKQKPKGRNAAATKPLP